MSKRYFREESRKNYGAEGFLTDERLQLGCLMRIADAMEHIDRSLAAVRDASRWSFDRARRASRLRRPRARRTWERWRRQQFRHFGFEGVPDDADTDYWSPEGPRASTLDKICRAFEPVKDRWGILTVPALPDLWALDDQAIDQLRQLPGIGHVTIRRFRQLRGHGM